MTLCSKLGDQPARTYYRSQDWARQPGAHHEAAVNISRTRQSKLLVVSGTGDPLTVADPAGGRHR